MRPAFDELTRTSLLTSRRPHVEHTELEEELHTHAHIDYDRVAIIANPSVPALYEDALVYETGTAMTNTGALTAYSGAKTGRSPLDKRIVKEDTSDKDVWWGPVNKPMSPEVSHAARRSKITSNNVTSAKRVSLNHSFGFLLSFQNFSRQGSCLWSLVQMFPRNLEPEINGVQPTPRTNNDVGSTAAQQPRAGRFSPRTDATCWPDV